MIAHDLARPFAILKGVLYQVKKNGSSSELVAKLTHELQSTTVYVDNLLAVLIIDTREHVNKPEPLDLEEMVREVWKQELRNRIQFNLEIRIWHLGHIFAGRIAFQRLLANLLGNAVESMEPGAAEIWVHSQNSTLHGRP